MLGNLGQQEFGDSIKNIRDLNRLGSTKWQNKQAENEELYKNYMNEAMWAWPHMRGQAMRSGRTGAFSDVFNTIRDNNISLENLANLNTNYQEMEMERDNYRTQIGNQANQYQGQVNSLQSQLNEQRRLLEERQRQAEQERLASQRRLQDSQREQERLSSIVPNWGAFNKNNYSQLSAHDLAREFYRSQNSNIAERARTDHAFRNSIDSFLGYPNQGLAIRR